MLLNPGGGYTSTHFTLFNFSTCLESFDKKLKNKTYTLLFRNIGLKINIPQETLKCLGLKGDGYLRRYPSSLPHFSEHSNPKFYWKVMFLHRGGNLWVL